MLPLQTSACDCFLGTLLPSNLATATNRQMSDQPECSRCIGKWQKVQHGREYQPVVTHFIWPDTLRLVTVFCACNNLSEMFGISEVSCKVFVLVLKNSLQEWSWPEACCLLSALPQKSAHVALDQETNVLPLYLICSWKGHAHGKYLHATGQNYIYYIWRQACVAHSGLKWTLPCYAGKLSVWDISADMYLAWSWFTRWRSLESGCLACFSEGSYILDRLELIFNCKQLFCDALTTTLK